MRSFKIHLNVMLKTILKAFIALEDMTHLGFSYRDMQMEQRR